MPPPWGPARGRRPGPPNGPAGSQFADGPRWQPPAQELRQLREEIRGLREAIQELTEQLRAARSEK